jgi:hypothetical protein
VPTCYLYQAFPLVTTGKRAHTYGQIVPAGGRTCFTK